MLLTLIVTYLLGRRWLVALGGPSVADWEADRPPLWEGQPAGF